MGDRAVPEPCACAQADVAKGRYERETPDQAEDALFADAYARLREMAARWMNGERCGHTLQPTALVHEAYLALRKSGRDLDRDRTYFFAAAASAMHQILVAHARRRSAGKRGGGARRIALDGIALGVPEIDVLELHDAMGVLVSKHPRSGRVAELRLFGGLPIDDIAALLGVSARTVDFDWRFARATLMKEIGHVSGR